MAWHDFWTRPRAAIYQTQADVAQLRADLPDTNLINRLEKLMADMSTVLAEVAAGLRGPLATSITALIAENTTLRARNAELEGEDAAESAAADDVRDAFDDVAGLFAPVPDVDVDPLPDPPADPVDPEPTPA
jgi:hypothetical protein